MLFITYLRIYWLVKIIGLSVIWLISLSFVYCTKQSLRLIYCRHNLPYKHTHTNIKVHMHKMCLLTHPGGSSSVRLKNSSKSLDLDAEDFSTCVSLKTSTIHTRTHTNRNWFSLFLKNLVKHWTIVIRVCSSRGVPPPNSSFKTPGLAFLFIASL